MYFPFSTKDKKSYSLKSHNFYRMLLIRCLNYRLQHFFLTFVFGDNDAAIALATFALIGQAVSLLRFGISNFHLFMQNICKYLLSIFH